MGLALPFLVVASGLLALAFDCQVANAIHCFSSASSERFPQWMRWPSTLPPWSPQSFENILWFIRYWAVCTIGIGLLPLLARI